MPPAAAIIFIDLLLSLHDRCIDRCKERNFLHRRIRTGLIGVGIGRGWQGIGGG